ncbi:uncharacterized protein CMC5_075140 [Chondromyces crocatus]|uniref:Protein kinase domain-containing protein n=2 Tax=Chondromyces crocatus TaxID=52 RepID=A0A0K1ERK4_CHOCO|nr:uncharacterized protein CMC5_075140 [Chondromyces crocatus]
MGEVWRALDLLLGTEVAIKLLLPVAMDQFPRARERFRQEAQIAFRLGKMTPHVVMTHDAGDDPEAGSYLVMERVQGLTLREEMLRRGPLPVEFVAELMDQVAEALKIAHGRGILHRDLKPSNLLLMDTEDGRLHVKVADFGLAKAAPGLTQLDRPRSTCEGTVLGTLSYMSPEQAQALPVDHRTDLWALGIIAYEALLGQAPFRASSWGQVLRQLLMERPAPLSEQRPDLPAALDEWFYRALAKEPADRFNSAEEMAIAFRLALQGDRGRLRPVFRRKVRARSRGRAPRGIIAGTVALALAALGMTLPWWPKQQADAADRTALTMRGRAVELLGGPEMEEEPRTEVDAIDEDHEPEQPTVEATRRQGKPAPVSSERVGSERARHHAAPGIQPAAAPASSAASRPSAGPGVTEKEPPRRKSEIF